SHRCRGSGGVVCLCPGTELALKKSLEQVSFFELKVPGSHRAGGMPLLIFHLGSGVLSSVFPIHCDTDVKIMIETMAAMFATRRHCLH
ncbi:MAG: hypothetical protein AAGH74_09955, partial [Pseudomonadota bacterium]